MPPSIERQPDAIPEQRGEWRTRPCPLCGSAHSAPWMEERVDLAALDRFAFASRKAPEFMRFELRICRDCDLVFAATVPPREWFSESYREADFDAGSESQFAAATYARELARVLPAIKTRGAALDIGAGDGAFLAHVAKAGFASVLGVEPSRQPTLKAHPSVRPMLRNDFFRESDFEPASFDLITCFQTLEHLEDPLALCKSAHALLRPGGLLLTAGHNFRSPVARIMGKRSPIYDIEHLQLFSPDSLSRLYQSAGFGAIGVRPLSNAYPLTYWLKLMPLPAAFKNALLGRMAALRAERIVLPARVGNLIACGRKM